MRLETQKLDKPCPRCGGLYARVGFYDTTMVVASMECNTCGLDLLDDFPDCETCCAECRYMPTCEHKCEELVQGHIHHEQPSICCNYEDGDCTLRSSPSIFSGVKNTNPIDIKEIREIAKQCIPEHPGGE